MRIKLMVIIAIVLASLVCYIPAEAVETLALFSDQNIGMGLDYRDGNRVLRSSTVKINPDVIEAMEGIEKGRDLSSMQLSMTFFFESPMVAVFNRWERISSTGLALIGYVQGIPESEVIFLSNGSMMTGTITLPGQLFQIKPVENVIHELQEIDPKSYPEHLEPIPVPGEPGFSTLYLPSPDDGTQIDVMVVYTAAARDAAGSTTAIESQIDLAVVETNQGYANSGVTQRIRLVHKEEINYNESGFDWNTALNRLQNTTDGYMDNVHTLRDTYHADVVVLIVSASNYCGLGYLMQTVSPSFAAYAFCLVSQDCATGYYSFAHEMGHNMGAHHDRVNAGGTGAYPYSYGYQAPDRAFRTIMAYNCPGGCQRINYWSNHEVNYNGQPTGILYTDPNSADNRRTLNNTVSTVANFRAGGGLTLSVEKTGTGIGTVTSSPSGLNCGSTCNASFSEGTVVTLTAMAATDSAFISWTGCTSADGNVCFVTVMEQVSLIATFDALPPGLSVDEGTIGTQITIAGGGFGNKKGKVLIGDTATKIITWTPSSITCEIKKPLPPGPPYDVVVQTKEPKGATPITIDVPFTMMAPEIVSIDPVGSLGDVIVLSGNYFGYKKGKVYLEDPSTEKKKTCKVISWFMDPTTGESTIRFVVPKLNSRDYTLTVTNKVGTAETTFTIEP
jgi:hypothetical protein